MTEQVEHGIDSGRRLPPSPDPSGDLVATGVEFGFGSARPVVGPIDLTVPAGSQVALVGPSGSGKSTLLHLLAGLIEPTAGAITVGGRPFSAVGADERARVRLEHFGMVFQFAELVPELTLLENVELPLRILRRRLNRAAAVSTLAALGIAHAADRLPSQVSGGERQRAAIARAVIHRPAVILADEPTGALDQDNGREVLSLLLACSREVGASLVVVTHDPQIAGRLEEHVELRDGRVMR